MESMVERCPFTAEEKNVVKRWYSWLRSQNRSGWAGWCREQRVLFAKLHIKGSWELRRARYGPSGRRNGKDTAKPYMQWCQEHGKTPKHQVIDKAAEG